MKSKFKVLAAALAFAAAAPASATIITGASGDGELVFSIWDPAAGVGYVRDLGTLMSSALLGTPAAPGTLSFAADTTLTSFLTGRSTSGLLWNVLASETAGQDRIFTTVSNGSTPGLTAFSTIRTAAGNMASWVAAVNGFATHSTLANGSAIISSTDLPSTAYPGNPGSWNTSIGGSFVQNAGGVNDQLRFFSFLDSGNGLGSGNATPILWNDSDGALWSFNAATGALVFNPETAPIPEPSTWALMIAGLLGLGAIARRRAA